MPKEIFILRHGQTEFNAAGKLQGHCNSPLTELGRAQAKAYGVALQQRLQSAGNPEQEFQLFPARWEGPWKRRLWWQRCFAGIPAPLLPSPG
ncbi:phosphoglycerate mutase family protein [Shewanella algae]|uniref:phosphoglycerate mutase family protein n=1 Tax=Shewanella algae TaxID=38313 RepID=UPI001C8FCF46|nr:phosphoglycerate mutase family protein [Shewanella algae]